MTEAAFAVEQISKRYRQGDRSVQALENVSLAVHAGEVVALLGNNGAGKSTLMAISAGLLEPDSGSVRIGGSLRSRHSARLVGLAPQDDAIYPVFTGRRNLEFFGRLAGLTGTDLKQRVDEIARRLLIHSVLDVKASEMSGGQRRRLHTALALMHDPRILLLDEPTVGVDIDARQEVLEFVASLADGGAAVLYSTHQLAEVERLKARVVIIDKGRVVASGTSAELIAEFAPPLVELRFDSDEYELPAEMIRALDEASWTASRQYRVTARLAAADVGVSEVVGYLPPSARAGLLAAGVIPPNLENAYRRIVRPQLQGGFEAESEVD